MATSRKESFHTQAFQLTDAFLVWLAFTLSDTFRTPLRELLGHAPTEAAGLREMTWVLFVGVPFTPLVLEFFQFYVRPRSKSTVRSVSQLFRTLLVIGLFLGMIALFAKPLEGERFDSSRLVLALGTALTMVFLFIRDRALTYYLRHHRTREDQKERVVIAGAAKEISEFLENCDRVVLENLRIVERFDLEVRKVHELYQLLKDQSVQRVIFTAGGIEFDRVARAVEACELQGVEAWVAASFIRTQIARPTFDMVGDQPMLVLRSTPELSWELMCKAVLDRVGASILILFSLPLWIFAIIGIRLGSPGAPVFFSQKRAGRYGEPFTMWKFRTMVADAEQMLERIKEDHGNHMEGPVFKLSNDPRIFPFGALLRKFSIDELPQLLNVVSGEMSLVGPRPLPVYEVEAFCELSHRRRLSVKPGITCEWQAGGRNKISSFEEWVAMDLKYIDNWSLWLDLKILFRTIPAVLFGKGAA